MAEQLNIEALQLRWQQAEPGEILREALELFDNLSISFSGAEDVVLIHMAQRTGLPYQVFTLDTGRLPPETYHYLETIRAHFGQPIEVLHPDRQRLDAFVKEKGLFSFYEDGHQACCEIRKVEPLARKLGTVDAWVSGQRRDQSPTRADVAVIELDERFSTEQHPVIKLNPLANWSSSQVWEYIRLLEIPYNPLHDRGYISIGCAPCTRPVGPNQHEREGRWWWEEETIRECGLHREAGKD